MKKVLIGGMVVLVALILTMVIPGRGSVKPTLPQPPPASAAQEKSSDWLTNVPSSGLSFAEPTPIPTATPVPPSPTPVPPTAVPATAVPTAAMVVPSKVSNNTFTFTSPLCDSVQAAINATREILGPPPIDRIQYRTECLQVDDEEAVKDFTAGLIWNAIVSKNNITEESGIKPGQTIQLPSSWDEVLSAPDEAQG